MATTPWSARYSHFGKYLTALVLTTLLAQPVFGGTQAPGSLIGFDSNSHGSTHERCVLAPLKTTFFNMRPGHSPGYYKMNMVPDNSPGIGGHIQGVARLYAGADHAYFALSRSTKNPGGYGGGVHVGKYSGSVGANGEWTSGTSAWPTQDSQRIFEDPWGDVTYNQDPECRHPGGLSAIGEYLLTGWDAGGCTSGDKSIEIYNVVVPSKIVRIQRLDDTHGSANVAAVRLDDPVLGQKHLLAAGGHDMDTVEFFLCDDLYGGPCTSIDIWEEADSSTHHGGSCWDWWSAGEIIWDQYFSSIQFAVECGTGQVYMVGTNEKDGNEAHLYKVTYWGGKFHLEKICGHESFPETHGINFDGGASIYVDRSGRMQMYASGKCESGGCTSWNDTVIGQFWNDASIGYWSLDGHTGDLSSYDNDGTPVNGVGYGSGLVGQALDLDGVDDYVRIDDLDTFNGMSHFSLSAWIYPTQLNTHNGILSKVNPSRDFVLKLTGTGRLNAHFYDNGYHHCTSDQAVPLYAWSHVRAEWTGTQWKLYLDGNLVKTCNHHGYAPPWTGTRMGIGTMNWGELFTGKIDEVEIY